MEIIVLAIPLFLGSMALEIYLSAKSKLGLFRFWDSMSNLSCGVENLLMGPWAALVSIPPYVFLYEHKIVSSFWGDSVFSQMALWTFAFIGLDFFYYCYHRVSHRVNLFWAGHVVHHQSEEYNLSVALRQTATSTAMSFVFYLPLALAGVPLKVFLTCSALNLLYQFWIHTELIRKLPSWAEYVLNTPSHHRVHHATNPQYLDKNYAGVFVVWDRLFKTFELEVEKPRYGIVKPLQSWSSWWAQVHYFVELAQRSKNAQKLSDALRVWFMPPEWMSEDEKKLMEAEKKVSLNREAFSAQMKFAPSIPEARKKYSIAFFVLALLLVILFLKQQAQLTFAVKLAYSAAAACMLLFMGWVARTNPLPSARN